MLLLICIVVCTPLHPLLLLQAFSLFRSKPAPASGTAAICCSLILHRIVIGETHLLSKFLIADHGSTSTAAAGIHLGGFQRNLCTIYDALCRHGDVGKNCQQ